jgi:predicted MFS family arabinose efflux permease
VPPAPAPRTTNLEVRRALVAVLFARTAINGSLRVVYPFLPAIARGLDVSLGTVAAIVAVRNLGGLAAPVGAWAAERSGRRSPMVLATVVVAAGSLLTGASARLWPAALGMVVVGIAKPVFDVPMQAWFGDRVAYEARGRVLGITELAWPLGVIVVVPVSGVLIQHLGWQMPFVLVGVLAAAGALVVWTLIGSDRPERRVARPLELTRERVTLLGVVLLFSISAEMIFVVYGAWLETSVGLSVTGVGLFTVVVVAGEIAGEGAVAWVSDRIGLRRMTLGGLLCSGVAYLAFGLVDGSLLSALVVVVVWVATFEVTLVAAVPLASELAPGSRDRMMSLFTISLSLGRVLGALVASPVFVRGGIALTGVVAAGVVAGAAALLTGVDRD